MRKLTEDKVRDIRIRLARGDRQIDIAADHDITQQEVSAIKRRIIWRGVEPEAAE